MTDEPSSELIAEVNKVHRRYVRRVQRQRTLHEIWVILVYLGAFMLVGSLAGDALEDGDWPHAILGIPLTVLLLVMYWRSEFRRRR